MPIVVLVIIFIVLAFVTGRPLATMVAGAVILVGSVLAAIAKSAWKGYRSPPPIYDGETLEQYKTRVRRDMGLRNPETIIRHSNFRGMTWQQFEYAVEKYFNRLGYATVHTGHTGDQGVDIEAYSAVDQTKAIIQCKHYANNVGSVDVQKLAGAMVAHQADKAFLVTSADFTDQAKQFAAMCPGVTLIDGRTLVETWEGAM